MFAELNSFIDRGIKAIGVYTDSDYLKGELRSWLKERVNGTVVDANTVKMFRETLDVVSVAPFDGTNWLVFCDLGVVASLKDSDFASLDDSAYYVFFVNKYDNYLRLKGKVSTVYGKRLDKNDFELLFPDNLDVAFWLKDDYKYDIDSVFELKAQMNAGVVVESKKAIESLIGLGGITTSLFLEVLLRGHSTDKVRYVKKAIRYLETLGRKTSFKSVYNFMLSELNTLLEVKQLAISGNIVGGRLVGDVDEEVRSRVEKYRRSWYDVVNVYDFHTMFRLRGLFLRQRDEGMSYEEILLSALSILSDEAEQEVAKRKVEKIKERMNASMCVSRRN